MLFSILIPVRDDAGNLRCCLESLRSQDLSDCEILVGDDGSNPPLTRGDLPAGGEGVTLLRMSGRGPAAARNVLAEHARGEYLLFLDSDTQPDRTLLRCARLVISQQPGIRSFFGSYDDAPAWPSLVSTYRNLLHHHVHQQSAGREVSTFWCGCGVVQRALYLECGGLSETFRTPSIEDVAFGMRLADAGIVTRIVPDMQVKHLKRWTLRSWLYTDLFRRGIPWVRLMRGRREWKGQLNVSASQRVAAAAALATAMFFVASIWNAAFGVVAAAALGAFVLLNRDLFRLIATKRGTASAVVCVPLHLTYALVCVVSVVAGVCCAPLVPEYRRSADAVLA
jgi:glycosyltransferase involved in cell wall biosynthesis